MKKPDEKVIQSIVALKRDPYWIEIARWFSESLRDQREHNEVELQGKILRQGQGRAQELNDFLTTVAEAEKTHLSMSNLDT